MRSRRTVRNVRYAMSTHEPETPRPLQPRRDPFTALTERLSRLSINKSHDAYRDIDWDGPDGRIQRDDPRFRLAPDHPLGETDWYRSQPQHTQAELGLEWFCQVLRYGVAFESCLSRGLLEFAANLPNRSPEYRYAMHELIEESHHSLMFQEFINRSPCDPVNLPRLILYGHRRIARCGATFPELFFFSVLSGEIFVDHDNRRQLERRDTLHPLVRRILQIHVTEEARHVCFAEHFLRARFPHSPFWRRWQIRALLPVILDQGERMIMRPLPRLVRRFRIPASVLLRAFGPGSAHEGRVRAIVAPVYALLRSSPHSRRLDPARAGARPLARMSPILSKAAYWQGQHENVLPAGVDPAAAQLVGAASSAVKEEPPSGKSMGGGPPQDTPYSLGPQGLRQVAPLGGGPHCGHWVGSSETHSTVSAPDAEAPQPTPEG
jgi:hypothetical protein